ncbi:TPA: NAD(P)-dependent alcohol dehydrogenase [Candidatus Bathyarchaeota archaeon]|nr:NAD(P)-dependent alcohol dehydrogenase [Candidatus Bathyarchaeota archaeon]
MYNRMKAAVLYKALDMRIEEVPIPTIGPEDVLIKIRAVGICGSDVHYYLHGKAASFVVKMPLILGHECSGEIVDVGSKVNNLEFGQRVVIEPGFTCGKCQYCLEGRYNLCRAVRFYGTPPYNGVFSEYAVAPGRNVYPLPDNMSFEEGALIEPLAVGMMAAKRGAVSVEDTVAVLGAGTIGQMALRSVLARGVMEVYVTDVLDYRLEYAEKAGASVTINPLKDDVSKRVSELTKGKGVDVVIEASGAEEAVRQAFRIVKPGGRILLIGITSSIELKVPLAETVTKELDILGVFRYANVFPVAIKCVSSGKIEVKSLITHKFPFDKIIEGFKTHINKMGNPMKVQIIF